MLSVQQRFNNASQTYDDVAAVQRMSARKLCELIMAQGTQQSYTSVLDLGAGTGCMTETLLSYLADSTFTLADFAPSMLSRAAEKLERYTNLYYQCADFSTYPFGFHDLTVSNLALQWIENWQEVITRYFKNTHTLAFSCLLAGTFDDWYNLFNEDNDVQFNMKYPEEGTILEFLKTLDAEIVTLSETYPLSFANPQAFMRYLKALGASKTKANIPLPLLKKILAHATPIHVKYRIFYGVIRPWSS